MTARQHDRRILEAKQNRLKQLYINAAQHGYDAQPHVLEEIEEIEKEIGPAFEPSNNETYRLLFQQIYRLDGDISDMRKEFTRLQNSVTDVQQTLNAILVQLVGSH